MGGSDDRINAVDLLGGDTWCSLSIASTISRKMKKNAKKDVRLLVVLRPTIFGKKTANEHFSDPQVTITLVLVVTVCLNRIMDTAFWGCIISCADHDSVDDLFLVLLRTESLACSFASQFF